MLTEGQRQQIEEEVARFERGSGRGKPDLSVPVAQLCPVEDMGVEGYLKCLHATACECPDAVPFGRGYLCRHPLRVRLKKVYDI